MEFVMNTDIRSSLSIYFLSFTAILTSLICWLIWYVSDTRVIDLDGKILPGPTSMFSQPNINLLHTARKQRRVSEAIHDSLLFNVGDGKICASYLLGTRLIFLGHPEYAKVILSGHYSKFPKSLKYRRLTFLLGNDGLVLTEGQKWHSHRRMINPGFHFEALKNIVKLFNGFTLDLVTELKSRIAKLEGNSFKTNMHGELAKLTTSFISEAAFGFKMKDSKFNDLMEAFQIVDQEIIDRLLDLTDWSHKLQLDRSRLTLCNYSHLIRLSMTLNYHVNSKVDAACSKILNMLESVIVERIDLRAKNENSKGSNADLLDILIDSTTDENVKLSPTELRDHAMTFFFAGYDTTSAGMSWALYELAKHPEIQSKCQVEADKLISDSMSEVASDNISDFVYLTQVIKETLRLHPPAPAIGRRSVEEVKIGDYRLPPNSMFGILIHSIHRHPDFWVDPLAFNPDRFSAENVKETLKHPFQYIPFSAGPRNCIGQRFAMMEMVVVLAILLRNFTFTLDSEDEKEIKFEEVLVQRPKNLLMSITVRE